MRMRAWALGLCAAAGMAAGRPGVPVSALREGDILFQVSRSRQSEAVQLATHSKWSHMGMLVQDHGELKVLEAVRPVKLTPVAAWVARGKGGEAVVERLKDAESVLTPSALDRMRAVGRRFLGRDYDLAFDWDDRRLYCSELVWKVYDRGAGIPLSPLRRLGDFDLSAPAVRQVVKRRYGAHPPLREPAVSPQDIFESPRLVQVWPAQETR